MRDRADILVLIVGNRYGSVAIPGGRSITNLEYEEASQRFPVYVFVVQEILPPLPIWRENKDANFLRRVDNPKLFEFADYLYRASGRRVFAFAFNSVADITGQLRSQLAHLFTDALEVRKQLRSAKLPPELMDLPAEPLRVLLAQPWAWEFEVLCGCLATRIRKAGAAPTRCRTQHPNRSDRVGNGRCL